MQVSPTNVIKRRGSEKITPSFIQQGEMKLSRSIHNDIDLRFARAHNRLQFDWSQQSEPITITHCGYLLKRSNKPFQAHPYPIDIPKEPFIPSYSETISATESSTGAQFISKLPQHYTSDLQTNKETNPRETAMSMAADFFGCTYPLHFQKDEFANEFVTKDEFISNTRNNIINQSKNNRSIKLPLDKKIASQYGSPKIQISQNIQQESNEYFRNEIDGNLSSSHFIDNNSVASSDCHQPPDIIDPNDGHIWRAKYCILENGILYFYRNEADANSQKAKSERSQYSLFLPPMVQVETAHTYLKTPSTDSLSTSPMPRPFMTTTKSSSSLFDPDIMWEKRVALDCVGAVRSAENEYGKWSFVLLTPDDNSAEDQDCLILRSGSTQETQEWLFQIHRSLASIVKEMVFQHPTGGSLLPPEVHYSLVGIPMPIEPTGKKVILPSQTSLSYSPRTLQGSPHIHNSLSHGHGRNDMHRRRLREKVNTGARSRSSSFDSSQHSKTEWDIEPSESPFDLIDEPSNSIFPYETDLDEKQPTKYIPPHMRRKLLKAVPPPPISRNSSSKGDEKKENSLNSLDKFTPVKMKTNDKFSTEIAKSIAPHFNLGGCANKNIGSGSIMDAAYLKRSVKLGKGRTDTYGYIRNNIELNEQSTLNASNNSRPPLDWEVGAVSACGVRSSNEDAYLIANDLMHVLENERKTGKDYKLQDSDNKSSKGLFAVFDGHCGFQTARYAAEKFTSFLREAITKRNASAKDKNIEESFLDDEHIVDDLRNAIAALDHKFCNICTTEGREWGDSGATALITILSNESIYIANLGDCRGILCAICMKDNDDNQNNNIPLSENDGWTKLEEDRDDDDDDHNINSQTLSFWKEVTNIHSPSREDEKQRIENANGWITTEQEICIGQLQRIDLEDKDAVDILKRWFSHRFKEFNEDNPQVGGSYKGREKKFKAAPGRLLTISRICGELSVSRALGDKEFKSAFNARIESPVGDDVITDENQNWWEGPNYLPYPADHNQCFMGDLVSTKPEFQVFKVGAEGVMDEFLILACDGLWDVMDADDAARIARDLMYVKGWSAENSAARLAELAIHLGSSDNITVILIRFFRTDADSLSKSKELT